MVGTRLPNCSTSINRIIHPRADDEASAVLSQLPGNVIGVEPSETRRGALLLKMLYYFLSLLTFTKGLETTALQRYTALEELRVVFLFFNINHTGMEDLSRM